MLATPLVKRRITEAELAPKFLDRRAGFGLPKKANNLLVAVFTCSHVHNPNVMVFLGISPVRFMKSS